MLHDSQPDHCLWVSDTLCHSQSPHDSFSKLIDGLLKHLMRSIRYYGLTHSHKTTTAPILPAVIMSCMWIGWCKMVISVANSFTHDYFHPSLRLYCSCYLCPRAQMHWLAPLLLWLNTNDRPQVIYVLLPCCHRTHYRWREASVTSVVTSLVGKSFANGNKTMDWRLDGAELHFLTEK